MLPKEGVTSSFENFSLAEEIYTSFDLLSFWEQGSDSA